MEKQLGRVKSTLDDRHWLIWTSRKHILERARREMDLQGDAEKFPKPDDVLVTASQLSDEEKALILYRHAKAAGLELSAKVLLKKYANFIVKEASFTPERIRRFVDESLPTLGLSVEKEEVPARVVLAEIRDAIHNPTER